MDTTSLSSPEFAPRVVQDGDDTEASNTTIRIGYPGVGEITVAVTCPHDTYRTGTNAEGEEWSVKMPADYGVIDGTKGMDGDGIDALVVAPPLVDVPEDGDGPKATGGGPKPKPSHTGRIETPVFVVRQQGADREDKVIFGVANYDDAYYLYRAVWHQAIEAGAVKEPRVDWDKQGAERWPDITRVALPAFIQWVLDSGEGEVPYNLTWQKPEPDKEGDPGPELEQSLLGTPGTALYQAKRVPVGTETTRADGSRWRKVKDTGNNQWRQLADGDKSREGITALDTGKPAGTQTPDAPRQPGAMGEQHKQWAASFGLDGHQPSLDIHPKDVRVDAEGNIDTKPVLAWTDANGRQRRSYTTEFHNKRYRSLRQAVVRNRPVIQSAWERTRQPASDAETVVRLALASGQPPEALLNIGKAALATVGDTVHFVVPHADGHLFPVAVADSGVAKMVQAKTTRPDTTPLQRSLGDGAVGGPEPAFNCTPEEVQAVWDSHSLPDHRVVRADTIARVAADLASKQPRAMMKSKRDVDGVLNVVRRCDDELGRRFGHGPPPEGMSYVPPTVVAAIAEDAGAAKHWPGAFKATRGMRIAMAHGLKRSRKEAASPEALSFANAARDRALTWDEVQAASQVLQQSNITPVDALLYGGASAPDFYQEQRWTPPPELWQALATRSAAPTNQPTSPSAPPTSTGATSTTTSPAGTAPTSTPATTTPAPTTPGPSQQPSAKTPSIPLGPAELWLGHQRRQVVIAEQVGDDVAVVDIETEKPQLMKASQVAEALTIANRQRRREATDAVKAGVDAGLLEQSLLDDAINAAIAGDDVMLQVTLQAAHALIQAKVSVARPDRGGHTVKPHSPGASVTMHGRPASPPGAVTRHRDGTAWTKDPDNQWRRYSEDDDKEGRHLHKRDDESSDTSRLEKKYERLKREIKTAPPEEKKKLQKELEATKKEMEGKTQRRSVASKKEGHGDKKLAASATWVERHQARLSASVTAYLRASKVQSMTDAIDALTMDTPAAARVAAVSLKNLGGRAALEAAINAALPRYR